ncbi:hypothetical protein BJ912DRAFT_196636 [Pholiota molesta]|nr:hypothetical protein BJ912DRAFT_196636 [Pholiota molesta]
MMRIGGLRDDEEEEDLQGECSMPPLWRSRRMSATRCRHRRRGSFGVPYRMSFSSRPSASSRGAHPHQEPPSIRSSLRKFCVPLSCIRHGFRTRAVIPDRHSLFRFMSRSIPCPRSNSALVVRCSLLPSPLPVVALSPFLLVFIFACLCLIRSLPCERGFVGCNIWIFPTLLAFAGEGAVYIVPPRNPHISHVDFSSLAGSMRIRGGAVPREHYDDDLVF